ncbi:MAG: mobile mystery protein B [Vampirovibrionales bacterium]|nr:mobile mystery protein B [Vampirovibrionales bacterium]
MKDDLFVSDDAATPLTEDEKQDLIPAFITFRHELNAVEQNNILEAQQWVFRGAFRRKQKDVLDEKFLRELHKRMFNKVWKWAGCFRKSPRNVGVEHWKIPVELRTLLQDVNFWIEHKTYLPDEIAARFHHRLVWIHPFPNGNGRHARLATELLLNQLGQPRFTWGSTGLVAISEARQAYVSALRDADQGNLSALLAFVRT